jgi:hypothetical protein
MEFVTVLSFGVIAKKNLGGKKEKRNRKGKRMKNGPVNHWHTVATVTRAVT